MHFDVATNRSHRIGALLSKASGRRSFHQLRGLISQEANFSRHVGQAPRSFLNPGNVVWVNEPRSLFRKLNRQYIVQPNNCCPGISLDIEYLGAASGRQVGQPSPETGIEVDLKHVLGGGRPFLFLSKFHRYRVAHSQGLTRNFDPPRPTGRTRTSQSISNKAFLEEGSFHAAP
jgi:hypothetical protein